MSDLSPNAQKVYDTLKKIGATNPNALKTADDVMRASNMPKGMMNNAVLELVNKGYAKRVAREKSAGYYLTK